MKNNSVSATLKLGLTVNTPPAQQFIAGLVKSLPFLIIIVLILGTILCLVLWRKRSKPARK